LEIEACDRRRSEKGAAEEKAFELSQTLTEKWVSADVAAKRQLLEIVFELFVRRRNSNRPNEKAVQCSRRSAFCLSDSRDDRTPIELFLREAGTAEARFKHNLE
jgi:hypothetical protein